MINQDAQEIINNIKSQFAKLGPLHVSEFERIKNLTEQYGTQEEKEMVKDIMNQYDVEMKNGLNGSTEGFTNMLKKLEKLKEDASNSNNS